MSNKFQRKIVDVLIPEQVEHRIMQGFDVKAEYRILRKRAEQRIRDLESAGFKNLDTVRNYKNRFPRVKEIYDKSMLADAYAEVTRFLNLRQSTVGGYREAMAQAESTFREHYGDELPDMPQALFGEMMRAIKESANAKAYYKGWKATYRQVLSNADRAGLSPEDLADAIKNGEINLGPKGGLYDASTGAKIRGRWAGME